MSSVYRGVLASIGDSVAVPVTSENTVGITIIGSGVNATLAFKGSKNKGGTWEVLGVYPYTNGVYGTSVTTTSTQGSFSVPSAGFTHIRVEVSNITSGSFDVTLVGTDGEMLAIGGSGGGGSGTSDATAANQVITYNRMGDLTEVAPTTDTASAGLNGRLQRVAQRLTSLIGLLPASIGQKVAASSLAIAIASDHFGQKNAAGSLPVVMTSDQVGQKTAAGSLPVVLASDVSPSVKQAAVVTTDISTTITTGGTAQTLSAAQTTAQNYIVSNIDATNELLWINFTGGTAAPNAAGSYPLSPLSGTTTGGSLAFTTDKAVSVYAATTGHKISAARISQ